jgi:guanine nucleotide-binding protein alpha-1 subunit
MAPSRDPAFTDDDPLWLAIRPPPDETPEQKALRLKREAEAKKISDLIDEQIKLESAQLKKKKIVRLLLLGK